jgi:hypothetical protein
VDVTALIELVRAKRSSLVPFVGSGLTLAAGAPSVYGLARLLAERAGIEVKDEWPDLEAVVDEAERRLTVEGVRAQLVEIVTGWRLNPTPALTALCGTPTQRVITTNYDDGIERSARRRGLTPISLLPTDPRILDLPGHDELHVIHLHGLPEHPESLVLPGRTTTALETNEVFQTFVSSRLAPQDIVQLGFSFARSETHLHLILEWLCRNVEGSGRHYVLLPQDELPKRRDLEAYDTVTVVPYVKDRSHSAVERVCIAFAPRRSDPKLTWVEPVMLRVEPGDDLDRIRQRVSSFDLRFGGTAEVVRLSAVLDDSAALLVGGPGMGKSTLLARVTRAGEAADGDGDPGSQPAALGLLADFTPSQGDDPPERAIARLLHRPDGRRFAVDALDGPPAIFGLDGLDEVPGAGAEKALIAIAAAVEAWPQHTWMLSSRPTAAESRLREHGFTVYRIVQSRRWARTYLETRSVPAHRTERAMLDGYGLGDLMTIPVFASRLADRLLDDHLGEPSPLDLLTQEQDVATADEADREGEGAEDLGWWMLSLALALAVQGRASATREELTDLPSPSGVTGTTARERLVVASLLADVPDVAAFPHRSLQDALCARAILESPDPVATLRRVAVAEVNGEARLRDDWDFVVDLVFEHAEPDARRRLRDLDEQRWARTVVTCGSRDDARDAFAVIDAWHARRGWPFGSAGDGGLRTAAAAIREIGRRWPEVVEERRADLERDLRAADAGAARRALAALGALPADRAADWLLACLRDSRDAVVVDAAYVAARLRADAAVPLLMKRLDSRDERVRVAALRALVELVPVDGLPDLAACAQHDELRYVSERLNERVNVDTGIAVAARGGQLSSTSAWLLDRLIEDAHPAAWTRSRVEALMSALGSFGGGGQPDPDLVARAIGHHPDAAIEIAVRHIAKVGDGPYGPAAQMLGLSRVEPAHLAGDDLADLRAAVDRAIRDERARRARDEEPERAQANLGESIEEHGLALPPAALEGAWRLRLLSEAQREVLVELVDRWWPVGGFAALPGPGDATPEPEEVLHARLALRIGGELEPPLPVDRWLELLGAYLDAQRWDHLGLGEDGICAWLARTREPESDRAIAERMAAAPDANELSRLIAVAGRAAAPAPLVAAAFARLAELDPGQPWWGNAVGVLLEHGGNGERGRALLELTLPDGARAKVRGDLAGGGDPLAQAGVLDDLARAVAAGERPKPPHWWSEHRAAVPVAAARGLAETAIEHGATELRDFALGLLEDNHGTEALEALTALAFSHPDLPKLSDAVERLARRIATHAVIKAVPRDLAAAAAWFDGATTSGVPSTSAQSGASGRGRRSSIGTA